jgi:hypothetical protein
MTEGSGSGCESVLVSNGSGCGSGRPKNIRFIRIRIHNTGHNDANPTDSGSKTLAKIEKTSFKFQANIHQTKPESICLYYHSRKTICTYSVADPGCLSRILDRLFFHPGYELFPSRKNVSILTKKMVSKL